jgi:hypothetical protein
MGDVKMENKFSTLYAINVNDYVEKKNGLTYLSWANAWAEFKKVYPYATYEVVKFDGKPYVYDENLGYMCYTTVTVGDLTHEMWLPVMDGANKAMKAQPYEYTTKYGKKTCEAANMFDINKTIMRTLVKCLSLFGLALKLYQGDDLPCDNQDDAADQKKAQQPKRNKNVQPQAAPVVIDRFAGIKNAINGIQNTDALLDLYLQHQNEVEGNPEIKALFTARKQQLKLAA